MNYSQSLCEHKTEVLQMKKKTEEEYVACEIKIVKSFALFGLLVSQGRRYHFYLRCPRDVILSFS